MWRGNLEFEDVSISVETNDAETAELIQTAFAELVFVEDDAKHDIVITIENCSTSKSKWQLEDNDREISKTITSEGNLIYHLSDSIVFHVADKTRSGHCLHAAAVAVGDKACVIPASSGSGKSSFVAWLVANGFPYLTDELVILGDARQLSAVARPIQIKAWGIEVIEPLLSQGATIHRGSVANAVSAQSLGGRCSTHQHHEVTSFVFPEYNADYDYELLALSDAEAGLSLMGNHVNARNLEGHGFQEMMKLIRASNCYRLRYGGFDQLPEGFVEELITIVKNPKEV